MRIEEFLRNNGKKYDQRVVGVKNGHLYIEVQTLAWDGDESIKEFLVKDNTLLPIKGKYDLDEDGDNTEEIL